MRVVSVFYGADLERAGKFEERNDRYLGEGICIEVAGRGWEGVYSYPGIVRQHLKNAHGIITVLDADVYVPVRQLEYAAELCRIGYPLVLPYNGVVMECGEMRTFSAVGGAAVYNWDLYCGLCGGENPNMKLWGDDDNERVDRVEKFMQVPRVRGAIEHYRHARANITHEYMESNVKELEKIRKMSKEEVWKYAQTWG